MVGSTGVRFFLCSCSCLLKVIDRGKPSNILPDERCPAPGLRGVEGDASSLETGHDGVSSKDRTWFSERVAERSRPGIVLSLRFSVRFPSMRKGLDIALQVSQVFLRIVRENK